MKSFVDTLYKREAREDLELLKDAKYKLSVVRERVKNYALMVDNSNVTTFQDGRMAGELDLVISILDKYLR